METLKIAFIYDAVYPWIKGGAEKRIYEISKRLAKKHDVHWYGVGWWLNGKYNVINQNGITLHGVCKPMQLYVEGRRNIGGAIYFAWKVFPKLIRKRFDIVDCQEFPYFPCYSAKTYSLLRRSKLVITWHEVWGKYWFEYLGKKGIFGYLVERLTTKLTKNNIAVSEQTKRDLKKLGLNKVEVIPNGIDYGRIQKIRQTEEESDILFAGRLIKDKNVDILIRTVKILKKDMPDIKCIIIGDGPERQKLENLAKNLGLNSNIIFKGFVKEHDDVVALMKSSKIFVLPSTREGFGIVALEANACGLPVVTIRHKMNATKDLIKDGRNGFMCGLSESEIVNKVLIALHDHSKMSKECLEFAKDYDWNAIVKKCERFYEVLL